MVLTLYSDQFVVFLYQIVIASIFVDNYNVEFPDTVTLNIEGEDESLT
jgi:hypothetical protein